MVDDLIPQDASREYSDMQVLLRSIDHPFGLVCSLCVVIEGSNVGPTPH